MKKTFSLFAISLLVCVTPDPSSAAPDFSRDVLPLLSDRCFHCHGPDAAHRKAKLRLDLEEHAKIERDGEWIIKPGDPEASLLWQRIITDDEDDIMPPLDTHKSLSTEERAIIRDWIKDGAPWQKHWAFEKPERAKIPRSFTKGDGNPIDYFISKKLKEAGLEMTPPAERTELARRTAFDLTGLPPNAKLLSAFLADKKKGAFERYVKALIESPHFGEHMARYWLDAARYGDTHGMHLDNYREMWPYRDYVINAFNNNMPYDQFVVEQLAGDLLPNPTDSQKIATGFNRCSVTTSEGGAIPEELAVLYMVDRVETMSTVFLGLTTACASCHDHKFDPISMKEFYRLGAFFNNTTQPPMDGNQKDSPPVLTLPKEEHKTEWQKLLAKRAPAHKVLDEPQDIKAVEKWWSKSGKDELDATPGNDNLIFELLGDSADMINGAEVDLTIPEKNKPDAEHPSGKTAGIRFAEKTPINTDGVIELATGKPFTFSMWLRSPDVLGNTTFLEIKEEASAAQNDKDDKKEKETTKKQTSTLALKLNYQGGVAVNFHTSAGKLNTLVAGEMAVKPRSWQHLAVRYSGGQSATSLRISLDGEEKVVRLGNETLVDDASFKGKLILGGLFNTGGLSHVRLYDRYLNNDQIALLAKEFEMADSFEPGEAVAWKELSDDQKDMLKLYHQVNVDKADVKASALLNETQQRRDYIYSRSTTTLITEEKTDSKPIAHVLDRGLYDQPGEEVTPGVPEQFPPMPSKYPNNRLGLAKWIVDESNPLTARVTVNRLWQEVFGVGLVKTSEDFGIMGARPSHPELLDWLAVEFMDSGWDVQHMLGLMVASKAYQQSGVSTAKALEKDPENLLLSRGPRMRLDAEEIRDQALAVSGLLNASVGGPSVKPYQPAGLWKVVAFAGSNTKNFKADTGDKLYRRSLYTFWKRTSPPPSMASFDAPTREKCTVRRERTNTPLQALVLMNDPQFVEAARYLAQRSLSEEKDEQSRLRWLFDQVLGKEATPEDLKEMGAVLPTFKKQFEQSPKVAEELVKTGESAVDENLDTNELASWTMVAHILMNRDDFINN